MPGNCYWPEVSLIPGLCLHSTLENTNVELQISPYLQVRQNSQELWNCFIFGIGIGIGVEIRNVQVSRMDEQIKHDKDDESRQ